MTSVGDDRNKEQVEETSTSSVAAMLQTMQQSLQQSIEALGTRLTDLESQVRGQD